ncbi:MAG: hypothetical protein K2J18_02375 [Paramuribaculum sp.]|nr:hypothetical protein [Paramuribaculum sp.]
MEFDENKCIDYINNRLAEVGRAPYDDDEILNIVDMVYDYYDSRGLLDIDDDGEDSPERTALESDIVAYVQTMLKRDKRSVVRPDDVEIIVAADLDYEESLEEDI